MASPKLPNPAPENDAVSTCFSISNSLPPGLLWPMGQQAHLDGFAFWYRPDQCYPMPRRQHILKNRRAATHGSDVPKHRRTRNGCFTCRSRRVKCDEARPACDRCRKGNRPCEFPPPSKGPKRKPRSGGEQSTSRIATVASEDSDDGSKAPGEAKNDGRKQVPLDLDGSSDSSRSHNVEGRQLCLQRSARESGSTPGAVTGKNTSPSTEEWESISHSASPASSLREGTLPSPSTISAQERSSRAVRWAHLSPDLQEYLQYQQDSMTYHHYFFKFDNNDFLHTDYIDLALENDPLLYAAVGFAAYHHTLARSDGRLSHFLGYYSKAMSLLRLSLEDGRHRKPATLLTILQLATIEEYLGDWVHLIGHHRAAHHLLLELYNPRDILEGETGRQIFSWYSRFDLMAGLMAGSPAFLGREWYVEFQAYHEDQIDPDDVDIENRLSAASAATRLVAADMAALFAQLPEGSSRTQEFMIQGETMAQRLLHLRERMEGLNDGYYTVQEFPDQEPLTADDIVDPYQPGGLFSDAFWPLNQLWIDWYGLYQMFTMSMMTILEQPPPPQLEALSLDQCRIFEAIERWPASPKGSLLGCHESLTMAAVFLKKDDKHIMWCRKKMATVEQQGYMCPPTFRKKMAQMWQQPEIEHWWLPNDEGFSPLLREIRAFGVDRASTHTKDQSSERLWDISAIFSGLHVQ